MTHWEVYEWERDWPRFSKIYSEHRDIIFIIPHMAFGHPNQVDEILSLHPNVYMTISKKEKDLLYRQMIAELSTPAEKKEIMSALENMVQAHKRIKGEERQLVEQFSEWLEKASFTKKSFGRIRNFFQKTIFEHARDPNPDMEKYFKRRVLKKIELKKLRGY